MTIIKKETGYFKSYDGTKIYYEVRGEGAPIVMAYGIGCLTNHWHHQIRQFSKKYKTIVFDYRAHHKSEIPKDIENIGLTPLARDIQCLMKELEITKASFWGHSFGVQVLVKTYELFPELFQNLVFINGFASDPISSMFGNGVVNKIFETLKQTHEALPETSSYVWGKLVQNPLSLKMSGWLGGFNLNLTELKDIEIYSRGIASLDLQTYLRLFEKMMEYDGREVFDKIDVPCLIISGQKDSVTPQSYQSEMHERIKKSELVSIPYGSHCTQLDMPDYVNLSIENFFSQNHFTAS
jgi:pimeloyl-ACP methyl ester carboxylesterase